jgi:hypothetical protein
MIRIELNDEQHQSLRLSARQEEGRVSERIHFARLSDAGYSGLSRILIVPKVW